MFLGGEPMPLITAAPGSVSAVVPYDVPVAVTQQLIVLGQELDRFVTLGNRFIALDEQLLEKNRVVGKFQEGRVVHDSAA